MVAACVFERRSLHISGPFLRPGARCAELFDLLLRQMLDADKGVLALAGADQLIELCLDGGAIAVLCILNQEDHQKSDDGGSGVDD